MPKLEGSDWKGKRSLSLSLAARRRLKQAQRRTRPNPTAAAPTEPTVMPTTWGLVRVLEGVGVEVAVPELAGRGGEAVGWRVGDGAPDAVLIPVKKEDVLVEGLELSEGLELLDVIEGVIGVRVEVEKVELGGAAVVVCGGTRTMLGMELWTTNVATIVPWVLGSALGSPLHMV